MLTSKDRGKARKKPLITWSSTGVSILVSFTLITGGFILITPTLITAAVAQEGNNNNTSEGAATTTEGSLQSDLNFSEIPEFDGEFAQSEEDLSSFLSSLMSEVNGTYMNPNIGFQINLPTGWKGIEINFLINSVFAVPGETNLGLLGEGEDFQEPATFMTIQGIDQESFNELENLVSELPALEEEGGVGGEEGNPLGTTASPFADSAVSCSYSQPSFVTVNGINAEERVAECIDEEEGGGGGELVGGVTNLKTKSYTFATQNNSLIVLGFFGNSTSVYDQNLPLFEESVRTLSISRPADIATSEIYNRYKALLEMEQQQLSNQTGGGM
ncbi:MAG: hypothetical protein M3115_04905 [Thermoproteota archaeon]|nr:hypothetical protein [Thermoproteota archaeon]